MSIPLEHSPPVGPIALPKFPAAIPKQRARIELKGLTWGGVCFFLIALLMTLSARERFRIPIGGLEVHAYLLPMAPLFCIMLLWRVADFPVTTLALMAVFMTLFFFANQGSPWAIQESMKVAAGGATIITSALLIRSERDFRLGVIGLMIAVGALSIFAILIKHDTFEGADPLDMANENAFSLYTLAPVLLGGFLVLDTTVPKVIRLGLVGIILVVVVAMFSNANRSGWLGLGLIALLLLGRGFKLRNFIYVGLLLVAAYLVIINFADLHLIKYRFAETGTAHSADHLRVQLLMGCLKIGFENPLLGITPYRIPWELQRIVGYHEPVDSHNLFGYLIAGTGLITTAVFLLIGWTLFQKPARLKQLARKHYSAAVSEITPHRLMRMMIILYVVRGMFSREIIYSPGFCMGVGLVIGLCIVHGLYREKKIVARPAGAGMGAV